MGARHWLQRSERVVAKQVRGRREEGSSGRLNGLKGFSGPLGQLG